MSNSPGLPEAGTAAAQKAIGEQAGLTLAFYSFGIVMRKTTDDGMTEYPVSAEDVATALAAKVAFNTGILTSNTICVISEGARRLVIEYRPPQKTAIWLEGLEDALRVPLPGLLMFRMTTAGRDPNYHIYAVAQRPTSYDADLYHAPLPNIYHTAGVCWGTVARPKPEALAGNDLSEDWSQLLGTSFGNHSVDGKCKRYPYDIRKLYLEMEKRHARVYPKREMIPAKRTLAHLLAGSGTPGIGVTGGGEA